MTTDLSTTDAAIKATEILSLARESIVLVTVLIIAALAYVMWVRVIKPIMDQQSEIAKANAAALNSIQTTATAHAATEAAHVAQTEHLRETSQHLNEAARHLNQLQGRLAS